MKISLNTALSFKRRLRSNEEADYFNVLQKGKEKIGNVGYSTLIVPSASLPQKVNTGMGNLLDIEARKFIDFAKQYWGINSVQLLPDGQYKVSKGSWYLPYSGSSLDLGAHLINIESLMEKEYGNLLNSEDIKQGVSNKEFSVDFENVLQKKSRIDKILRKAYDNLLQLDTSEKERLLNEIKLYAQKNKDWIEPKSIYEALSLKFQSPDTRYWDYSERYLYDIERVSLEERNKIIDELKNSSFSKEIGFYEFKQYLAEKHLFNAKKDLNNKGISLIGDMLVGFSHDEKWANPKAFIQDSSMKWGLPAVNFKTTEGKMLLRQKVNKFAKLYDSIRIDAAWTYISQPVKNHKDKSFSYIDYDSKILEIIEDEARLVKGNKFKPESLIYEFVAGVEDFNIFQGNELKPEIKKRLKLFTSSHLDSYWGTTEAFKNRGWEDGSYVLCATNHDSLPLKKDFENIVKRNEQINVLSRILKIPKEQINNFNGFMHAKLAEPMMSRHNMFFFADILSLQGQYKDNLNRADDYRLKIPNEYQKEYLRGLEKGDGFNIMDSLEKAFVAKGLDKEEKELYKKIVKYKKILQTPEGGKKSFGILTFVIGAGVLLGGIGILINKKRVESLDSNAQ